MSKAKADQVRRFVKYMVEREHIRIRKEAGQPRPWTKDPILSVYKFTNVRRANDFTTRYFDRLYSAALMGSKGRSHAQILYLCGLYRYFGTTQFAVEVGAPPKHDVARILKVVKKLRDNDQKVFTGAYVITNGGRSEPKEHVVIEYLQGLWDNAGKITNMMDSAQSWRVGYEQLSELDGFGGSGFMAKEVLQDYLMVFPKRIGDVDTWTPVGPGARRGLNRIWGRPARPTMQQNEAAYIRDCLELRTLVQDHWNIAHPHADDLSAHDVQFCLCEFDKYERTRLGQGRPRSIYVPRSER